MQVESVPSSRGSRTTVGSSGIDGSGTSFAQLSKGALRGGSAAVPRYCSFRSHPGYCEFGIKRFYWDRRSGKCRQFHYNGRFGNANRFDTLAECRSACDVRRSYDKYV
ncbi:mambaquaretin-2-like isoform X1 [Amblyomma americanum]